MIPKILGAVMILAGCGGVGMMICIAYKTEEEMLRQMVHAMDYIQCELRFRMTPLPELCAQASSGCRGRVSCFWMHLSEALSHHTSPHVSECVLAAKQAAGPFPQRMNQILEILSHSLGQFDAQGQQQTLEAVTSHCRSELESMGNNRDMRLRSYQTLGICAGVALVILLV